MSPAIGFPPGVIEKGPGVPFLGGTPLALYVPPLPGFAQQLQGHNQFGFVGGSFQCDFSITYGRGRGSGVWHVLHPSTV